MKTTLEGNNSRIIETEEWIRDLEGKMVELLQNRIKKKKLEQCTRLLGKH